MSAVDFNQHRLSFRAIGSGIPVVALHGSAATARQWSTVSAHLGDGIRFIAPDMPGCGASAALAAGSGRRSDPQGSGCLQAKADRVSALLSACGRPVHLAGHSAGGAIALKIALARPDLVASLTLIEPVVFHLLAHAGNDERRLYREIRCIAGIMGAALADDKPAAGMARLVDFWSGDGAWGAMPAKRRDALAGQCGRVVADFAATFNENWPTGALKGLATPVQLMMGLRSPAVIMRITELLSETIDNAALTMLPDAGHMAPLTHPTLISSVIENHVRRAETAFARATLHSTARNPLFAA